MSSRSEKARSFNQFYRESSDDLERFYYVRELDNTKVCCECFINITADRTLYTCEYCGAVSHRKCWEGFADPDFSSDPTVRVRCSACMGEL